MHDPFRSLSLRADQPDSTLVETLGLDDVPLTGATRNQRDWIYACGRSLKLVRLKFHIRAKREIPCELSFQ